MAESATGNLGLPPSPRRLVFERIVLQLRRDRLLSRTVRTLLAWEGDPDESRELARVKSPAIRLTPSFGPDIWAFADAFRGWMFIDCELMVPGTDTCDMLDLWYWIMRALYPPNPDGLEPSPAMQFQRELRECGRPYGWAKAALTGQIEFSQPAADPSIGDGVQQAQAQMRIEIDSNVNS